MACSVARADENDDALEACSWTLSQLTQLELAEDGRLKLKTDHWEIAAKRPLEQSDETAPRARFRNVTGETDDPLQKLLSRLMTEAGAQGTSSRMRDTRKTMSWEGRSCDGVLITDEEEIRIDLRENLNQRRVIRFRSLGEQIDLFYFSAAGHILQLSQSKEGTRFCSTLAGEPRTFSGPTFAHIVQANKDFFEPIVGWPVFLGELPVSAAMEVKIEAARPDFSLPNPEFPEAEFASGKVADFYSVFTRFRIFDGRLRYNWFFGNPDVLTKETETLVSEFGTSLDQSLQRLTDLDAPQIQVNSIQERFGQWKTVPKRTHNVGKFDPLLSNFLKMQTTIGSLSFGRSSGGDISRYDFGSEVLSAHFAHSRGRWDFQIDDDGAARVQLSEDDTTLTITVSTDQNLILIEQAADGSCLLTMLHGDFCRNWTAPSWLTLVHEHEVEFRERVVPILAQYHMVGLDVFHPEIISAVMERLKKDHPAKIEIDSLTGNTDASVMPLLNDRQYLQLLTKHASGEQQELVKKRLELLAR